MIDRSQTLAKKYIKNWYNQGAIKSSSAASLAEKYQAYSTLDNFVLFAIKRYNMGYEFFPSDYQNDLTFVVAAIKQSKDSIGLLTEIANLNRAMYVRILENLDLKDLIIILGEDINAKPSKTKLVAKLRKEVNNKIIEAKTKNL